MKLPRLILLIVIAVVAAGGTWPLAARPSKARNVILFVADAGGLPTLHAASIFGHGAPGRLFVQRMPHIGLSDTSAASDWVTDSAAGMTALVTGARTQNGVLSQSADAVKGVQDGAPLKTILEYAEERGLATGVISNDSLTGATPAALYAKSNDRGKTGEIILQALAPRFGDGVDVMIGSGRTRIYEAVRALGRDLDAEAGGLKRPILASLEEVPPDATRAIVLLESSDFDVSAAVQAATRMLARNRKGYFLMVESDVHTDRLPRGLERMVAFDRVIGETAARAGSNTLVLFTADHSFDMRVRGGKTGAPLLAGLEALEGEPNQSRKETRLPAVRMDNGHTGEEVLVAAQGPGAERVRGYMANTDIFGVMMEAFGWKQDKGD
jgi:alkaline phosphatase